MIEIFLEEHCEILCESLVLLGFGVVLIILHLIYDYLQKEFWAPFTPVLKVLACVDMILLLLLSQQVDTNLVAICIVFRLSFIMLHIDKN
jgi:predicted MFS family arabinose efflux permease